MGTTKQSGEGDIPLLQISTLGGLCICLAGEPVQDLASRKVEALLVYLACERRAHPRETLAEMFWAEHPGPIHHAYVNGCGVAINQTRCHQGHLVTLGLLSQFRIQGDAQQL